MTTADSTDRAGDAGVRFGLHVHDLLDRIATAGSKTLPAAASLVADTVQRGDLVYAFGSGHSQSVAIEFYDRAGGLAGCDVIADPSFGRAERVSGYAAALLEKFPVAAGDLLFVISNSGRNPLPVEMAECGRTRGMTVVGITSLDHSRSVASRAPGGRRLFEVCDLVIDTCTPRGDAAIDVGDGVRVGAASTIAGAFVVHTVVCLAAEALARRGVRPPVYVSMNVDDGDARNRRLFDMRCARIRGL